MGSTIQDYSVNNGISGSFNYATGGASSAMDTDVLLGRPFAIVDEITESSPAAEDGLVLGDQVVKFGHVEFGENLNQRLAAEARAYQGQEVPMIVLRQGAPISLTVTPRAWAGSGLLGYVHFLLSLFLELCLWFLEHRYHRYSTLFFNEDDECNICSDSFFLNDTDRCHFRIL